VKVHVDWDLCDGNGACQVEVPEVFQLDDDDNLAVLQETPDEALRPKVEAAARMCPKHAITVEG
jgi:ferredoxin